MKRNSRAGLRRGVTMIELMVAVLILGVLASIALVGYQGYRDRAAMLVDETNQKVLQAAVKLYAYDHNALPGSISQLRPEDLNRAYALVLGGRRPYTLLAYLAEKLGADMAEAAPLPRSYYQNNDNLIHCPVDNDGNGVSYQINRFFENPPNNTLASLLAPGNQGLILVFESDAQGDNGADPDQATAYRHQGGTLAVTTTVAGVQQRKARLSSTVNAVSASSSPGLNKDRMGLHGRDEKSG